MAMMLTKAVSKRVAGRSSRAVVVFDTVDDKHVVSVEYIGEDADSGNGAFPAGAFPCHALQQRHVAVMHGAAAGLLDHPRQPWSHDLARLELQGRREDPNHRNAKRRTRQIDAVGGDATCFQPFQGLLQA
jgi:hypothetical protein